MDDGDAFSFLARSLARARLRWDDDVLALVRAVAVHMAKLEGSASEDELASWCRRQGLPVPDLRDLFERDAFGDWTYLRAGRWRFDPRPAPILGEIVASASDRRPPRPSLPDVKRRRRGAG